MKWGIYMPLLSAKWWGKRLQEMHFGQIVVGKVQFIINLTILLKVFDAPIWTYPVGLVVSTFLLWYSGYFLEKSGIRKEFRNAEFKDTNIEK